MAARGFKRVGADEDATLLSPEQIKNTPSRKDDISEADEKRFRRDGAKFIRQLGAKLEL